MASTKKTTKRKPRASSPHRADDMIGKTFRSVIGDCNVLWEVKSSRGRGAYVCEAVNEPFEINGKMYDSDFAGTRRTFGREEIEAAIDQAAFFAEILRRHEDFYDSLALGQIVHYHDGFGQYVRCEVVTADGPRKNVDHPCVEDGEKCLKEIALVGNWRDHDLCSNSYHMRGVLKGRLMKPNASNIWENPKFDRREGPRTLPDPTVLEPLTIKGQQEMFA